MAPTPLWLPANLMPPHRTSTTHMPERSTALLSMLQPMSQSTSQSTMPQSTTPQCTMPQSTTQPLCTTQLQWSTSQPQCIMLPQLCTSQPQSTTQLRLSTSQLHTMSPLMMSQLSTNTAMLLLMTTLVLTLPRTRTEMDMPPLASTVSTFLMVAPRLSPTVSVMPTLAMLLMLST